MIDSKRMVALALAAALGAGCTSDEAPPPREEGGGGCNVDYARLADHRKVAFRADVMPILNGTCGFGSSCHDSNQPEASLVLGDVCRDDAGAPAAPGMCAPLTEAAISAIYANLIEPSRTAPAVQRVARNRPAESFLLDKAADLQNEKGYACTPQDPNVEGCGTAMPPGGPSVALCTQRDGQQRFDVVAAWVLQGAPND